METIEYLPLEQLLHLTSYGVGLCILFSVMVIAVQWVESWGD